MTSTGHIQDQFAYHYGLFDRIWQSIDQLAEEQFVQDVNYSHGSIRNQIVHIAVTERRWLMAIHEHPDASQYRIDPKDYSDKARTRLLWNSTREDVNNYIDLLHDDELARIPNGLYGPVWQVLTHLVNHGTDHRAQILRILHDFGAPTFDQDLIMFLWQT